MHHNNYIDIYLYLWFSLKYSCLKVPVLLLKGFKYQLMQSWENVIYLQEQVPQMQGNPNVKRKVAVLIAYNGKGYHGIQR